MARAQLLRVGVNVLDMVEGPRLALDPARAAVYDALLERAVRGSGVIDYDLALPKHEFLSYLVHRRGLLAHGSNRDGIEEFEPRPANDLGTHLTGVYAASDAIRPMYFATVARGRGRQGLYNGAVVFGSGSALRRYYFFAILTDPADPASWTDGTVYLLPPDTFRHMHAEEWISDRPVRPLARLPVSPDDFPFRSSTVRFSEHEPFRQIRRRFRQQARAT
jgi:hypothetical protein